MSQHDEFDRSLSRWFEAEARPASTADVLDHALRATRRRRPRPGLFAGLGSHWVGDGVGSSWAGATLGRAGLRTSIALLLLVLALVAAAVLGGALRPQPAPDTGRLGSLGHLAYVLEDGLYVAGWDGRNPTRIVARSELPAEIPDGCRKFWGGPTWSPDGRHLAVRTLWDDACGGFILITDAGGSAVTMIPGPGYRIAWSPDSSRVVNWIEWGGAIGIYGIDGERQALLPAGGFMSGDRDPSWTSDGTAVLDPHGLVWPLDGTPPHPDRRPTDVRNAAVSLDGNWVARVAGTSIIVGAIDGSSQRALDSDAPSGISGLLWSPTGDRIAFLGAGSGPGIVDVATGATTSLELPIGEFGLITFAPEGDQILVAQYAAGGLSSLWSVQADGSGARELVADTQGGDWQVLPPGS